MWVSVPSSSELLCHCPCHLYLEDRASLRAVPVTNNSLFGQHVRPFLKNQADLRRETALPSLLSCKLPKRPAPATASSASFGGRPLEAPGLTPLVQWGSLGWLPSPGVPSPPLPRGLTPNDIPPICTHHLLPPTSRLSLPAYSVLGGSAGQQVDYPGDQIGVSSALAFLQGTPHLISPYLPATVQPPSLCCVGSGSSLPSFQGSHGGGALDLLSWVLWKDFCHPGDGDQFGPVGTQQILKDLFQMETPASVRELVHRGIGQHP